MFSSSCPQTVLPIAQDLNTNLLTSITCLLHPSQIPPVELVLPTEENSARQVEAVLSVDTDSLQLDNIAPPSPLAGNLPIDIIHEVLERWIAIDQNVSWTALRISRRWSQAVTCYSPIWRRICLNPVGLSVEECRSRVAENVRYASNSPLDIHIRWYGNLSLRSKRLEDKAHLYDKAMRAGIWEARKASSTWKSLSLHVCSTHQIDELLEAFRLRRRTNEQGLAGLQSLRIVADEESPFYEVMGWANLPKAWFLQETPNLRSLICLGFRFRSGADEKLPSFFSALRTLTLGRCTFIRVTELRNMMETCTMLEELTLVDISWSMDLANPDQGTTLTHSSLRQLRIFCASRLEPSTIVAMNEMRLTLPSLQRLQVCRPVIRKVENCWCGKGEQREGDEDGTALLKFVERLNTSLVDLHIAGLIMRDSQLQQLLRLVPHLRRLTASFSASLLLRLAVTKAGVMLCPRLQNLTAVGCHEEHVASLGVVAQTRMGKELSCRRTDEPGDVLRNLRVQGCPKTREQVEEMGKRMAKGVVSYSDEDEGTYNLPP
ncbi:hypothetical protein F5I97DRAFT_1233905 [Phlebopus sp. FC_14]|nr:hypothetical protein F5I97DRAFT_1233905 [Phlebopus sp. FC_14]